MAEPLVTKEYFEDLGTKDSDGYYDYAYRYWVYWFDLDGRKVPRPSTPTRPRKLT